LKIKIFIHEGYKSSLKGDRISLIINQRDIMKHISEI
jgi:hypothetical protein